MVEKDPNGVGQHEPGAKLDDGKPDASLLGMFGKALLAVSAVGTFGARKYTRGGWVSVPDGFQRYTAALWRHLLGEGYEAADADSGLPHEAHAAWNALARLEIKLREDPSILKEIKVRLANQADFLDVTDGKRVKPLKGQLSLFRGGAEVDPT